MAISVGDSLPTATLHETSPGDAINPSEVFRSGKVLLFGVPGAFTPGCDQTHLPGYINDREKYAAKGIDTIACISVNDAFVMQAWGKHSGAADKVRMLADPQGEFVTAMGLDVDAAVLGGTRSKRFAMVVENGKVTHLQVEPDGFGLTCSLSENILAEL
ncbi:MAG: 2-Cys peroxiredoxin 5 [Myxococcota bacterium]|jgi:2-Cys peroxiredoxin 5